MCGDLTLCGDPNSGKHKWEALKTALKPNGTQDLAGACQWIRAQPHHTIQLLKGKQIKEHHKYSYLQIKYTQYNILLNCEIIILNGENLYTC